MNSEETVVTLKLRVNYGWDETKTTAEDAYWNAIQMAINPDFSEVVEGAYLNQVVVYDGNNEVLRYD